MQKLPLVNAAPAEMIGVGRFGKSVGLKGGIRIHIFTDFPEILTKDSVFYIPYHASLLALTPLFQNTNDDSEITQPHIATLAKNTQQEKQQALYLPLTCQSFKANQNVLVLQEIARREHADILRNMLFYSTIEDTRKYCNLSKDEYFYFDIIGLSVVENGEILGVVQDIQEIANTHYLVLEKHFLIPYIDRYICSVDMEDKQIHTKDARFLRMD